MQNSIDENDAWAEIGAGRKSKWEGVVASLEAGCLTSEEKRISWRLAPSIIARNVAELFEVAMPRFAIRTEIVSETGTSIVNLHRIELMQSQRQLADNECRHELNNATGIGDSVLAWPGWAERQRFLHRVKAPDLMRFYGEVHTPRGEDEAPPFDTTSYVHGLPLSGLCAQASCFMVSAMMQPWIENVYGFSEITLLSHEDFDTDEINRLRNDGVIPKTAGEKQGAITISLSGLRGSAFKRYFERAGLACSLQRPLLAGSFSAPTDEKELGAHPVSDQEEEDSERHCDTSLAEESDPEPNLESAIRAYLRSGFPVIYPCDLGRLKGEIEGEVAERVETFRNEYCEAVEHVYQTVDDPLLLANAAAFDSSLRPQYPVPMKDRRHAVVIVGCYRDSENKSRFIFHDPSRLPYMTLSASELFSCRPYCDIKVGEDNLPPAPMLEIPGFYSVTEREVRLPLLPEERDVESDDDKHQAPPSVANLHRVATRLYDYPQAVDREQIRQERFHIGELILTNPKNFEADWEKVATEVVDMFPSKTVLVENRPDFLGALPALCHKREKIWIQILRIRSRPMQPAGYLAQFWRAETEGTDFQQSFLAGGFLRDGESGWTVLHTTEKKSERIENVDIEGDSKMPLAVGGARIEPDLALITSYRAHGITQNRLDDWPVNYIRYCELYAFMAKDVEALIENCTRDEGLVPALANRAEYEDAFFEDLARKVLAHTELHKSGVRIFAMATYFPEISCRGKDTRDLSVLAKNAIRFLIRLAGKIRALDPAVPDLEKNAPFYIELVGGGLAEGIEKSSGDGDGFEARIDSSEGAIEHLVDVLLSVRQEAVDNNVVLSVEFEPGLLNVLGHRKHLEKFCELLDAKGEEANFIGLNLDIAHFDFLGRIAPDLVRKTALFSDRIVHAHISDHSNRGHFGDAVVGAIHEAGYFAPWFDLLAEINAQRGPQSPDAAKLCSPLTRNVILPFSGVVSIEQEACKSIESVSKTIEALMNERKINL